MKKEGEGRRRIVKPWPTKDAMEQIYRMNLWGGNDSDFYSGAGSHDSEIVNPYIEIFKSFLSSFTNPITLCDLGCGDFNVGKELVRYTKKYVAVDIVADLIKRNKANFKEDNLEFQCIDIAEDNLPSGDCAVIRQVLQHLSNSEVQKIVTKLSDFKYIILTEHLPEGDYIPNKDILSGQGIRLNIASGIDLLAPPFNFKVKEERRLFSVPVNDYGGEIVTTLYET